MHTKRRQSFKNRPNRSSRFAASNIAQNDHFALPEQNSNHMSPNINISIRKKGIFGSAHKWSNGLKYNTPSIPKTVFRYSRTNIDRTANMCRNAPNIQLVDIQEASSGSWIDRIETKQQQKNLESKIAQALHVDPD